MRGYTHGRDIDMRGHIHEEDIRTEGPTSGKT